MYALKMIINHYYWKYDHKCHYTRQVEKEALESHSWKQGKASTSGIATASQNKANISLVAWPAKNSFSKSSLSPTPKKQPNILQMDLSSKLASNGNLISDEHKKYLKNNLCLYCSIGDHELDSCPKKQTIVIPKGCSALATASKKPLEK